MAEKYSGLRFYRITVCLQVKEKNGFRIPATVPVVLLISYFLHFI